jgi:hypothetical protein
MKVFWATLLVLVLAFAGIRMLQTPSATAVQASTKQGQQENMTQFSADVAKFMKADAVKNGAPADTLDISAKCKPNQGEYGTRCWINIKETTTGAVEKATAENVRRRGDKFVWDRES